MALCAGDEEEWDQQCSWNSALLSSLDKLDVSVEQLQQDEEKWITQGDDWPTTLQAAVWIMALLSFSFGEWHSEGTCSLPFQATVEMDIIHPAIELSNKTIKWLLSSAMQWYTLHNVAI